jgi:uncharacterized membrane protein YhiD involved in acid resistance
MNELFDGGSASGPTLDALALLARMGFALLLGTLLAWRPLSRLAGGLPSKLPVAYALVLMTLASTLAMVLIGDSVARAFGVVGLGSFVRFRTAIKDPGDAVLFFVAIGVGMACALGVIGHAALGVAAISVLLVFRDRAYRRRREREESDALTETLDEVPAPGPVPPPGRLRK